VRALISVYDKAGVDELAQGLVELGCELVASGGTAAYLEEHGLPVTRVESLTRYTEMLGHRVVTLHPAVHGAILARRDVPDDLADLAEHEIEPFDLVVVNLYPFTEAASRYGVTEEEAVEMIDIGGPALLRAAAKNFAHVGAVARPERYSSVLAELRARGELSLETRRSLAAETFVVTAAYESAISAWFSDREAFPEGLIPTFWKDRNLAYGENPHQRAAYYAEAGARRHLLSRVDQLQGKELSYNNLNDLSAARWLVEEFTVPACVIVKHANPCGVAIAGAIEEAYERALGSDPVSAYGGVVVLNRPVGEQVGARLAEQFVEVLFAPGYEKGALDALRAKENVRVLVSSERRKAPAGERDFRRVLGGLLAQDRDADVEDREGMVVVCGEPGLAASPAKPTTPGRKTGPPQARLGELDWGDLLFAWRVCKHVASNAIVIAKDLRTIGVGAGQMSRVDAVRIAVDKARELGHDLEGAALASDAFFPFPDGPQLALDAGVRAIIQPGGSKRDSDVVAAVESAGATMVFTGRRHFRH
jgi:phosphoribosylaminoimidazolecarboxamide formyltransferase/IMP cyclohydrolase